MPWPQQQNIKRMVVNMNLNILINDHTSSDLFKSFVWS